MAKLSIATKKIAEDLSGVLLSFTNGTTVEAMLDQFTPEIQKRLALHGLAQKVGDSYSGEKDVEIAIGRAQNVVKALAEGNWARTGSGGGGGSISDLVRAFAEATGQPVEDCIPIIDGLEKSDKLALRKHKDIAPVLARYAAERAAKKAEEAAQAPDGGIDLAGLIARAQGGEG